MKKALLLSSLLFARLCFASGYQITIDRGYDEALVAMRGALASMGVVPSEEDHARRIVRTEAHRIEATAAEVDCGTLSGRPYVDDARTVISVRYHFFLTPQGEKQTDVRVRATLEGRFEDNDETSTDSQTVNSRVLKCRSTGGVEKRLLNDLKNLLAQSRG